MDSDNMRFMGVSEVAKILGIGKSLEYEYLKSEGCPFSVIRINSRYAVPYNSFKVWYESFANSSQGKKQEIFCGED